MVWELAGKFLVGAIMARSGYVVGRGVYTSYLGALLGRNANFSKMGKWAVVTGATDGLGKAYAIEMAKKNLNVVLISRSQDKLDNVSHEIASKYNVETKTIAVDFTNAEIYEKIGRELQNLEVGVLINNVGMTYDFPKEFQHVSEKHMHDLINCNIVSASMMTKLVLKDMQKRDKGVIINMSSIVHLFPSPYLLYYASLKQFLLSFSKGLHEENKHNNVIIQCVIPGVVTTKFSGYNQTNYLITTPEKFVVDSLKATGLQFYTYGSLTYRLQATASNFFNNYVHTSIVDTVTTRIYTMFRNKAISRNKKIQASLKKRQAQITEIKETPANPTTSTATTTATNI